MEINKHCNVCNQHYTLDLPITASQVDLWMSGELIQDVMPELSADQREQLISGTHPECWATLFGDEV